jgi:hypothetical protein
MSYQKKIFYILGIIFILKSMLAISLPLTGDEAYFYLWSQHLNPTFYDHPPMVGWVIAAFDAISKSLLSIRFLAIVTPLIIAILIFRIFRPYSEEKSFYASAAIAFAPFDILHILITNDTTLLIFGFLAIVTFLYALERTSYKAAFIAGLFFGMAFLSKYLAFILAVGLFAGVVRVKFKNRYKLFLVALLATTPFIVFNLYANAFNCWTNIVFNLNRTSEDTSSAVTSLSLLSLFMAYLLTPALFYYLIKNGKNFKRLPESFRFLGYVALSMTLLFVFLSFKKTVGLHWLLFIIPLYFIVAIALLNVEQMRRITKQSFWIGALHCVILIIALSIPYEKLANTSLYQKNLIYLYPDYLSKAIGPKSDEYFFATGSYTTSAYLYYYTGIYFGVFGSGSSHGREDDRITNYALLNGKNISIVASNKEKLESFIPFFQTTHLEILPIKNGTIAILWGDNFNFPLYKAEVLKPVFEKYYAKPSFLPMGECFWRKYGMCQK